MKPAQLKQLLADGYAIHFHGDEPSPERDAANKARIESLRQRILNGERIVGVDFARDNSDRVVYQGPIQVGTIPFERMYPPTTK